MQAQDSDSLGMRTIMSAMNLCHWASGLVCPGVAHVFLPYIIRNTLLLSSSPPEMVRGSGHIFATNPYLQDGTGMKVH